MLFGELHALGPDYRIFLSALKSEMPNGFERGENQIQIQIQIQIFDLEVSIRFTNPLEIFLMSNKLLLERDSNSVQRVFNVAPTRIFQAKETSVLEPIVHR